MKDQFNQIQKTLFTVHPPLDYAGVMDSLIELCALIKASDDEFIWSMGESGECTLDDLIVGAFWHFTEWHKGQDSKSYAVLSALGSIFSPNMSELEDETSEKYVYDMFEVLATD